MTCFFFHFDSKTKVVFVGASKLIHCLCSFFVCKAYTNVKMKCPECSHNVKKTDKFCSECGTKLSVSTDHSQGKLIYPKIDSLFHF